MLKPVYRQHRCLALLIRMLPLVVLSGCPAGAVEPVRRVYIDQTHQFQFAAGALGKTLAANGYDVVSSLATFPPPDLGEFDVLSVHQWGKTVPFEDAEIEAIRQFVTDGGGLYLVGCDPSTLDGDTGQRLDRIAGLFGCRIVRGRGRHPIRALASERFGPSVVVKGHWPNGVPWLIHPVAGQTAPPAVVAQEANGGTVAVALEFGKGRVFLGADPTFMNEGASDEQRQLILRVFRWLARKSGAGRQEKATRAGFRIREPDLSLQSGNVEVLYPRQLEAYAQFLADASVPIRQAISDFFGVGPRAVRIVAITGGGYAGGNSVAIGVSNTDESKRSLLLWELTNSTPLPSTRGIVESWAVFTVRVLGPKLKIQMSDEEMKDPWSSIEKQVLPDDPNLDKYDISINVAANPLPGKPQTQETWGNYRKKKCALILRDLYERYGVEFIRRAVVIDKVLYREQKVVPSFDEWVRELSLAAGQDLRPLFRRYGTTLGPMDMPASPADIRAEGQRLVDQWQQAQARQAAEEEEYRRLQPLLAADTWAREWQLTDNLGSNDISQQWLASPLDPPAALARLRFPKDPGVRGLLVMHPRKPDTPAKLQRILPVPTQPPARLMIGGMKRQSGGRVVLNLYVDDQRVWRRELLQAGESFRESVALAPFAGKAVRLRLEADSEGEWNSREVLIDYVTLVTDAP